MSFFKEEIERLTGSGLHRSLKTMLPAANGRVIINGKDALLLCSNNYLGLADHPALTSASLEAISRYGAGSGASRLVSGNLELHELLEQRIAAFEGKEAAILFNSGYAANVGTIQAVVGRGDSIYSDRLNHASIVDGAILSRARFTRYPHKDYGALRKLLEKERGPARRLIVTDGVFSMDGDLAPLQELVALKREFNALLMVDEAHATAVMGHQGRGSADRLGVTEDIDILMGTLGKGLGSFGAYVAGSSDMIDYLMNSARSFIFSTSLPPAVLAASIAALTLAASAEGDALRSRLEANRALFAGKLENAGFDTLQSRTQIIPVMVGPAAETMNFSKYLLAEGIFVQGIRPPTVPAGKCRLRCTVMAVHSPDDLESAADTIVRIGKKMGLL